MTCGPLPRVTRSFLAAYFVCVTRFSRPQWPQKIDHPVHAAVGSVLGGDSDGRLGQLCLKRKEKLENPCKTHHCHQRHVGGPHGFNWRTSLNQDRVCRWARNSRRLAVCIPPAANKIETSPLDFSQAQAVYLVSNHVSKISPPTRADHGQKSVRDRGSTPKFLATRMPPFGDRCF